MAHGLESVFYDNIGNGWRIECPCGFVTSPNRRMQATGEEFDDHLEQNHALPSEASTLDQASQRVEEWPQWKKDAYSKDDHDHER